MYSKSINESRSEMNKSEIQTDLQANKIIMLEDKIKAMEEENLNKFN